MLAPFDHTYLPCSYFWLSVHMPTLPTSNTQCTVISDYRLCTHNHGLAFAYVHLCTSVYVYVHEYACIYLIRVHVHTMWHMESNVICTWLFSAVLLVGSIRTSPSGVADFTTRLWREKAQTTCVRVLKQSQTVTCRQQSMNICMDDFPLLLSLRPSIT